MRKQLIICLIICVIMSLSMVSAENNTEPTIYVNNQPTIEALEGGDSNISFADGYKGYCAEWGEHSAEAGQEFYIESTSKMNNSNSTINVPNYENYNGTLEYNGTYEIDNIKNSSVSTSDQPNILGINKKTGANLWLLGCVIILIVAIWIIHKRS